MLNSRIQDFIVLETSSIADGMKLIEKNTEGIIFTVDRKNRLTGSLSDGDIRRFLLNNPSLPISAISCKEASNKEALFITRGANLNISFAGKRLIPVLNENGTMIDVIRSNPTNITIGKSKLSKDSPSLLIAEIGNNHNGSLEMAFRLIDEAKKSGADAVKFQLRHMDSVYRDSENAEDIGAEYVDALLKEVNLSRDEMEKCINYAREQELIVGCTPFDHESLMFLKALEVDFIKIASADLTNIPLIKAATLIYIPLIVSTGMSNQNDIDSAVKILEASACPFVLLHCNSTYPTPYKDINLKFMKELAAYSTAGLYGYSGHERGWHIPLSAIALGAKVIEKHFTLDKSLRGNDHRVSLLPQEFEMMKKQIREFEDSIGSANKVITQGEMINRENLAKSIVASKDLKKGETLGLESIDIRSPGRGLQPNQIDILLGKTLKHDVSKHNFLYLSDVEARNNKLRNIFKFKRPFGVPVRFHDVQDIVKESNLTLIEFHLTYKDLSTEYRMINLPKTIQEIVVHSPELFYDDHLLDLATNDLNYRSSSIEELRKVVEVTLGLSKFHKKKSPVPIVVNVGGFSTQNFIENSEKNKMYKNVATSLGELETEGVEFLIQTMPPYPWHFGGQSFHNLFVHPEEIIQFCKKYNRKICLDISHSAMSGTFYNLDILDFIKSVSKYVGHIHISDAKGLDGEGLQINKGELDFFEISSHLNKYCPNISIIPEIWQGHKDQGKEFYKALRLLEESNLN